MSTVLSPEGFLFVPDFILAIVLSKVSIKSDPNAAVNLALFVGFNIISKFLVQAAKALGLFTSLILFAKSIPILPLCQFDCGFIYPFLPTALVKPKAKCFVLFGLLL